jgi:hypothetical protein
MCAKKKASGVGFLRLSVGKSSLPSGVESVGIAIARLLSERRSAPKAPLDFRRVQLWHFCADEEGNTGC